MPDHSTRNVLHLPLSTDGGQTFYTNLHTTFETIDLAIARGNWAATTDPAVTDDISPADVVTLGPYSVGSLWWNVTGHKLFSCEDNTNGAAVWRQIYPSAVPAGNFDIGDYRLTAQTLTLDLASGGAAPMTITSTTKIDNLNADLLDGKTSADFALLGGLAGGQTLKGGTAASENLTLMSTNHGTKGKVTTADQIQSTLATGTSPFAVSSTTVNTNLNADQLDGQHLAAIPLKADLTTKGDIWVATAASTPARLGVGTEGQALIAQAAATEGMAWDSSRLDGWVASPAITYAAADAPVYTVTITGDYSAIIMAGMRFKLTDTTVKYFIVVKSSYSNPSTTLTLYGGTDYTLSGSAMTLPYYSVVKAPSGFPADPAKWTVTKTDTADRAQATPTNLAFYNIGTTNTQLSVPIGAWRVSFNVFFKGDIATGSGYNVISIALSTANNSVSHPLLSTFMYVQTALTSGAMGAFQTNVPVTVATKTTMYLIAQVNSDKAYSTINFHGDWATTALAAECAYL